MTLRRLGTLALSGVLLLGAACGDDDNDTQAASELAVPTTADDAAPAAASGSGDTGCNVLSKSDIETSFGGSFGDIEDTSTAGTTICTAQRTDPFATVQFTIKPSSASEYDATIGYSKKTGKAKAEPVTGVGEKATMLTMETSGVVSVQVLAVKGSALFYTTATSTDPAATKTGSLQLVKLFASRL